MSQCAMCGAALSAQNPICALCLSKPVKTIFQTEAENTVRTLWVECKPSDSDELLRVLGSSNLVQHIAVTPMSVQVMTIHEHDIHLLAIKLKTKMQLEAERVNVLTYPTPDPIIQAQDCPKCGSPRMFCVCEPLAFTG